MYKKNHIAPNKDKRSKVLIYSAVVFITLVMLSATTWLYIYLRQNIRVKEIIFTGNQHLKNDDLLGILKVAENDFLYRLSSEQMRKNLMKSPWIKDAMVRKELLGRIHIKLTETVPAAILFRLKKPYLVDSTGVILEEITEQSIIFLPVIMEIDPNKNSAAYKEALAFLRLLSEKKLLSYSGQLEITGQTPDDLTIMVDEILIKIGSGDYEKKLERLDKIKEEIKNRNIAIEYIDIRFSEQIIVKPLKQ